VLCLSALRLHICGMSEMTRELQPVAPVFLAHRFAALHPELISLLRGLEQSDWNRPTACAEWSVKDIAAHLLDGNVRRLSFQRDGFRPPTDDPIQAYPELVAYLNRLNAEWVRAARRLSPELLVHLLDLTGPQVADFFLSLDPFGAALFSVAWAGEDTSLNWFDIAREYTERWLHQQQIREAVGAPGLTGREWLHPVLDVFLRALPFSFRPLERGAGCAVGIEIQGDAGGDWTLRRSAREWELLAGSLPCPDASVRLSQDTAWRLLSKGLRADEARERVSILGDSDLGNAFLRTLSVMA
jgi:uncharacterized protein (TIGR03083 family)